MNISIRSNWNRFVVIFGWMFWIPAVTTMLYVYIHERRWSWQLIFYFFFLNTSNKACTQVSIATHLTHTTSSCFFPTRIFNPVTPLCHARIWQLWVSWNNIYFIDIFQSWNSFNVQYRCRFQFKIDDISRFPSFHFSLAHFIKTYPEAHGGFYPL